MITAADMQRIMAAPSPGQAFADALERALARVTAPPRTPADLLRECEHAAGIATADTTSTENRV